MNRLKYSKGLTLNLGNYESARIDIGIEVDVQPEGDLNGRHTTDTFNAMVSFIEAKLKEERRKVKMP